MASIFTYDPDPPRVSSPWSTSGSSTPQVNVSGSRGLAIRTRSSSALNSADPDFLSDYGISKLEPEPQEGPTEYKLHLLLRPRRPYLSMSTGHVVAGSYHSRNILVAASTSASPSQDVTTTPPKPMQARSSQSRQQRLQGLTTQLLWRLQQSSPFHSSTTANLVVPVLPDATPQLGVPPKPTRLLAGLEESQGALYEIGVADDGTFVGLTQDELDESVTNLQAMAASLGCSVEILRRVIVGKCEWVEDLPTGALELTKSHSDKLWVAEALVTPDLDFYKMSSRSTRNVDGVPNPDNGVDSVSEEDYSHTEQIRISIAGPSTAGKSSLLGALTSSQLDNGRGKSRLSLLKHRHEISSGITSSVAQELIGYADDMPTSVVNYASGNVAAWDDIHATSRGGRLAFVSDLPGSVRYVKSTLRGLVSWAPHYVMLCIPANCGEETAETEIGNEQTTEIVFCLAYLELCLKLDIPFLIVITKLDIASRSGLRENLAKVLSALKTANRKPAVLPPMGDKIPDLQQISGPDGKSVQELIKATNENWSRTVPIVLSSAVDGSGIGKLHAFLRYLPIPSTPRQRTLHLHKQPVLHQSPNNVFDVDEVFAIPPSKVYSATNEKTKQESRGMVLCGLVRHGSISVGDEMTIGPLLVDTSTDGSNDNAPLSMLSRSSGPGPSNEFPASFPQGFLPGKDASLTQAKWQRVRVVSVRNLRLSVRCLIKDQVGTIGIEILASPDEDRLPRLSRIRKGMVLTNMHQTIPLSPSSSSPNTISTTTNPLPSTLPLPFHTGFIATFPASEFSALNSPPLLLGGNSIVYIANIRTTVRVICMELAGTDDELPSEPQSPDEPEFFSFDGDAQSSGRGEKGSPRTNATVAGPMQHRQSTADISKVVSGGKTEALKEDVRITFALITSVEWIELGSQVLVMPGVSVGASSNAAVGSGPGSSANGSGFVTASGLEGFVGTVCEVIPGRSVGNE
ncbi:uncharacterized protein N7484_004316 [Penicillium longicatenatum]|uniref:uncharacterized protein n=1 Tax=Penicillium longicatenatum TaxID=1561947 RepID=UPI0025493686|nr:uncharacterized protein N7484_004316 [Penicillium longicatenatum]KAJ5650593.1 hypothetical protein N7484_004316 [Penicillium longicatenatum]